LRRSGRGHAHQRSYGIVCSVPLREEFQILKDAREDAKRIVERLRLLYWRGSTGPQVGDKEFNARMAAANAGLFLFDLIGEIEREIEDCHTEVDERLNQPFGRDEEVILLAAKGNDGDGAHRSGDAPERW
jgi:hypothetical protein